MELKEILRKWAETEEHQYMVDVARLTITRALMRCRKPYVAFSGGKDSTCVLHLVLEQEPNVLVLHWDYGPYYIPRWLEREFVENARRIGAQNIRVETSAEYERLGRKAINVLGSEYLGKLVPRLKWEGYDLAFVGLRKEESVKRRIRINMGENIGTIPECWPIAEWSWKDVWAYIFSHDLPYASVYDLYAPVVGWENARLTTFFDPEFDKFGNSNLDGVLMWRFRNVPPRFPRGKKR